jgi:putative Mn2+ efflux pump MntP
MNTALILAIVVGLAMDAFSVAVATTVRLSGVSRRQIFRLAFHFGLFQAMMPVIGWAGGKAVEPYIRAWDHWIALALLGGIGVKAIYEALRGGDDPLIPQRDPTRSYSLVLLSVATSIDALAVGLSLGILEAGLWYPCVVIGVVTAFLTVIGMLFGTRLGARFGKCVEVLGGIVLIAIGIKIVLEHIA